MKAIAAKVITVAMLAGCAHQSVVTKVVPVPSELTQPVPEPQLQGTQNADLVTWIDRLREALREANRRLRAISDIGK